MVGTPDGMIATGSAVVITKIPGPRMLVLQLDRQVATCAWFTTEREYRTHVFPVTILREVFDNDIATTEGDRSAC